MAEYGIAETVLFRIILQGCDWRILPQKKLQSINRILQFFCLSDEIKCLPLYAQIKRNLIMTGITAKRISVSAHKTAMSCGLTPSAAIRRVSTTAGSPSAAIPDTVIIGDRGLLRQAASSAPIAANSAPQQASPAITIYNNHQNLHQDDQQHPQPQYAQNHT